MRAVWGALVAASVLGGAAGAHAQAGPCPTDNGGVPPGANTTNPGAPFFIDTRGLDLATSPPTRDPANPAYPRATALPDGVIPSPAAYGNFIIGPSHPVAPDTVAHRGVPRGTVRTFTLSSAGDPIYSPGVIRDDRPGCRNSAVDTARMMPGDPSNMLVPQSHAGTWTRDVDVYVPAGVAPGSTVPILVFGDGGHDGFTNEAQLFATLDNLIAARKIPAMVAVGVGSGGQDAQGAERGREYDAVDGRYGEWVERVVLPRAAAASGMRFTDDPAGRATMGISSSGVAAFTMAWFHPEWFGRVLAYSPTFVNQQWPHDTALPGGAWEYHSRWTGPAYPAETVQGLHVTHAASAEEGVPLILAAARKPIRFWFETGDRDLFYPAAPIADGMHDWTLANERTAAALAQKNYNYQFVFSRDAKHVDKPTVAETLPEALEWVWAGYRPAGG